jgi:hypothetical protein
MNDETVLDLDESLYGLNRLGEAIPTAIFPKGRSRDTQGEDTALVGDQVSTLNESLVRLVARCARFTGSLFLKLTILDLRARVCGYHGDRESTY